jgi:hypothetical protein
MQSSISLTRAIVGVRTLFEEGALNCSLLDFLDRPRPLQIERRTHLRSAQGGTIAAEVAVSAS